MLAILGLFGFAIATVMMTGDDPSEPEEQASDTLSDSEEAQEVVPIEQALDFDEPNFFGESDAEVLRGTDANNEINGMGGDDWIDGEGGDDTIRGGAGDDTILGGDGDDAVLGHVGDDTLFGNAGADELNGGGGDDTLFGGEGDDSLLGSLGNDVLIGGAGSDVLFAGSGDDVLVGSDDDERDEMNGGAGDDILFGGRSDNMNGGDGADTFVMKEDAEAHVDDFNPSEDRIEIMFDPSGPAPTLALTTQGDVTTLTADGAVVARFAGAPDFDLSQVTLTPDPG